MQKQTTQDPDIEQEPVAITVVQRDIDGENTTVHSSLDQPFEHEAPGESGATQKYAVNEQARTESQDDQEKDSVASSTGETTPHRGGDLVEDSSLVSQVGDFISTTNATRDGSHLSSVPSTPKSRTRPQSVRSTTPRSNGVSAVSQDERASHVEQDRTPTLTAASEGPPSEDRHHKVNGDVLRRSEGAPEVLTNGIHGLPDRPMHSKNVSSVSVTSFRAHLPEIHDHLVFLFDTKNMYDVVMQINQPDNRIPPSIHYAHTPLLLRSERLAKSMTESHNNTKPRQLHFFPARNVLPHAIEAAMRFFYTDQLLTVDMLPPRPGTTQDAPNVQWFEYIMSYWIAGVELGLTPVKARSFDLLKSILDWDIAELLVREHSFLHFAQANAKQQALRPEVDEIANALLQSLLHLFNQRFDISTFKLDLRAGPQVMAPRFESLDRSRHGPNASLSGVVFGSLSVDDPVADGVTTTASAILLHSDASNFEALANRFMSWHGADGVRLISQVIDERERAREALVSDRAVPNRVRLEQSVLWHEAGLKEYIENDQVQRRRVGYLLSSKGKGF